MRNVIKLIAIVTIIIFALLFSSWYYLTHHFNIFGECGDDHFVEMRSPKNDYLAIEFRRNCGATTDWATLFELKNLSSENTVRILSLKGDLVSRCNMEWIDESSLNINCAYIGDAHLNLTNFEGIKIKFNQSAQN